MSQFVKKHELKPFRPNKDEDEEDEDEPRVRINIDDSINTSHIQHLSFAGEQVGALNFHLDRDVIVPPILIPSYNEENLHPGNQIEDIAEIEQDSMHEVYAYGFHDPTLKALPEDTFQSNLGNNVSLISDRHILRDIVRACYKPPGNGFYSGRKDFQIIVTNVKGKVLLTPTVEERWEKHPGGYGKGLQLLATVCEEADEELVALASDMRYYLVMKTTVDGFTMLIRYQVDAVDEAGGTLELKSKKEPNPRYPLDPDFYLHIWGQMALSDIEHVVVVYHRDGIITRKEQLDLPTVQRKAGLNDQKAKCILARLLNFLRWLCANLQKEEEQMILTYSKLDNAFSLKAVKERVKVISEELREKM